MPVLDTQDDWAWWLECWRHVLHAAEGGRFRVVALTGDELGVELEELGSPVMIIVPLDELGELFSALQEPGGR